MSHRLMWRVGHHNDEYPKLFIIITDIFASIKNNLSI